MGQKTHPKGFRLWVTRDWSSRWYAGKSQFANMLQQDILVREFLLKKLKNASISKILIERTSKTAKVTIFSARPGVIIGKKGEDIDVIKKEIQARLNVAVHVNIEEVRRPELDAQIAADGIASQLEKRIAYRRAIKRAMQSAMKSGAKGIKVMVSGRLNGVDIARSDWYREGRVPLHTLRADIDYAATIAKTTYGILGIKVWIYKGDIRDRLLVNVEAPRSSPRKPSRTNNRRSVGGKVNASAS